MVPHLTEAVKVYTPEDGVTGFRLPFWTKYSVRRMVVEKTFVKWFVRVTPAGGRRYCSCPVTRVPNLETRPANKRRFPTSY